VTHISYAQNFEDVMLARALADVRSGFYVDVGAQDPVIDSVTRLFYERGWSGINIEPVPHWFERLQQDRPRDINLMCAAASKSGSLILHESADSGLSTASAEYARGHAAAGKRMVEREVPTARLDDILDRHAPGAVHFLKIDVEGMEQEVLAGLSLQRHRPWILVIEATRPNTSEDVSQAWEPIVLDAGYRLVYRDGLNRFYLAREQMARAAAFDVPPNVFDDFISQREHAGNEYARSLEERLQELHRRAEKLSLDLQDVTATAQARQARMAELDAILGQRQALLEATARQAEAYRVDLLTVTTTAQARQQRIDELEAQRNELERQRNALAKQQDALRHDLASVAEAAENRRIVIGQLHAQLHEASMHAGRLQQELDIIHASRSWRMTAPLRRLASFVRETARPALRSAAETPLLRRIGARLLQGRARDRVLRLAGFPGQADTATGEPTTPDAEASPLSRAESRVYGLLEQAKGRDGQDS